MPEARSRTGTSEGRSVKGGRYKPAKRRVLGQKPPRPLLVVDTSTKPRALRKLPPAAEIMKADDVRDPKVEFTDYAGGDTVTRSLTNAADMSGADSERNVVMMSFNWSCDVSKDGGGTWKRLDPTTIFPNTLAGGFCCDQVVIYVPHADLFVWFLQYNKDTAGQGAFRIAVASSSSVGSSPTNWTYWDFVAGDFGFPTSDMDYPDLAYSDEFLYVSTDVFSSGRVVMRISLKDLQGGGTVSYSWTDPDDGTQCWGAHLVQQTGDRGMWAGQVDNSHLVFFTWPDNSGTYSWGNVTVAAWPNGTLSCPGPDGNDWLKKLDNFPSFAVTGGVEMANGRVALAWSAAMVSQNLPHWPVANSLAIAPRFTFQLEKHLAFEHVTERRPAGMAVRRRSRASCRPFDHHRHHFGVGRDDRWLDGLDRRDGLGKLSVVEHRFSSVKGSVG